jgi:hypothetical protein
MEMCGDTGRTLEKRNVHEILAEIKERKKSLERPGRMYIRQDNILELENFPLGMTGKSKVELKIMRCCITKNYYHYYLPLIKEYTIMYQNPKCDLIARL